MNVLSRAEIQTYVASRRFLRFCALKFIRHICQPVMLGVLIECQKPLEVRGMGHVVAMRPMRMSRSPDNVDANTFQFVGLLSTACHVLRRAAVLLEISLLPWSSLSTPINPYRLHHRPPEHAPKPNWPIENHRVFQSTPITHLSSDLVPWPNRLRTLQNKPNF